MWQLHIILIPSLCYYYENTFWKHVERECKRNEHKLTSNALSFHCFKSSAKPHTCNTNVQPSVGIPSHPLHWRDVDHHLCLILTLHYLNRWKLRVLFFTAAWQEHLSRCQTKVPTNTPTVALKWRPFVWSYMQELSDLGKYLA